MFSVLQIYKDYCPPVFGGIEKHLALLSQWLSRVVDVEVLVANRGLRTQEEVIRGIRVTKAGSLGRVYSAPLTPLFWYLLGRARFDILHFHLPNPTAVVSYLLARPAGKVVVTWHSDIVRQARFLPLYRPFLLRFLRRCDVILPTSERYARTSPFLREFLAKCRAIPLGIDVSRFKLTESVWSKKEELRSRFGPRIVLFVGLLRYYKGLSFLIDAMAKVDGRLVIVGDGPMRQALEAQSKQSRLEQRVTFVGAVSEEELPAYYHCCDVFCLPSIFRSEGFGVSQLEAMVCGKPVVSTRLDTGVCYVNLDGKTGIVVEPMDSDALAGAITRLLDDTALAARLGEFARRRVLAEFTVERMGSRVLDVYKRLLGMV